MDRVQARQLAEFEMSKHGLPAKGWRFRFNTRKRALGLCSMRARSIYLSTYFLDKVSTAEVLDTIRHEIAHALEFIRYGTTGHGPVWRAIAVEVGAKPQAKYAGKVPHAYPYVIKYEGKVVKGMFKLPADIHERLKGMSVRGKPESKGKLQLFRVKYD